MQGVLADDNQETSEAERLLSIDEISMEMADLSQESSRAQTGGQVETRYRDDRDHVGSSRLEPVRTTESTSPINAGQQTTFKVYKMRWFGLGQLVLLNIVVSWDVGNPIRSNTLKVHR